jgi:outer membrane protein OmpA-like peptidoglycan-associated protein
MKVRYSVFAAALAAGVSLAAPAFAAADEKTDAANDAKWRCKIDNICDGSASVVGAGIEGEAFRPLIEDGARKTVRTTAAAAPAAPSRPSVAQRGNNLTTTAARPLSTGRRKVDTGTGAVSAPKAVVGDNDLFVTFRRNSAELESGITGDMRSLAKIVLESLAAGNKRVIQIGGYTDATGDDDFNMKLSQDRAETVRKSLMELGVPGDAIEAAGFGETKLIDGYSATHGINRRVEVVVLN